MTTEDSLLAVHVSESKHNIPRGHRHHHWPRLPVYLEVSILTSKYLNDYINTTCNTDRNIQIWNPNLWFHVMHLNKFSRKGVHK
jgi:hypothetical protein